MANCKQCGKEVNTIGTKPRIYCSDRCRKAFSRQEKTDRIQTDKVQTDKSNYHQPHCKASSHVKQFSKGLGCSCLKPEHTALGNIRVSKPGDDDYEPQCETTRRFINDQAQT